MCWDPYQPRLPPPLILVPFSSKFNNSGVPSVGASDRTRITHLCKIHTLNHGTHENDCGVVRRTTLRPSQIIE